MLYIIIKFLWRLFIIAIIGIFANFYIEAFWEIFYITTVFMFSFGYSFFLSGPAIRYTLPFIFNMFLSYSYLYTTSILHPSYLLNPTNLSNLSTQPYLNLCPFLLKNYPRYVPLYAYRGFESSGQIYFHFMKSSILKTFTTSLSRYQHNTLHMF